VLSQAGLAAIPRVALSTAFAGHRRSSPGGRGEHRHGPGGVKGGHVDSSRTPPHLPVPARPARSRPRANPDRTRADPDGHKPCQSRRRPRKPGKVPDDPRCSSSRLGPPRGPGIAQYVTICFLPKPLRHVPCQRVDSQGSCGASAGPSAGPRRVSAGPPRARPGLGPVAAGPGPAGSCASRAGRVRLARPARLARARAPPRRCASRAAGPWRALAAARGGRGPGARRTWAPRCPTPRELGAQVQPPLFAARGLRSASQLLRPTGRQLLLIKTTWLPV